MKKGITRTAINLFAILLMICFLMTDEEYFAISQNMSQGISFFYTGVPWDP